jgi:outer membrane protein assembly factor BamB
MFGSSAPAVKPTELQTFKATADAKIAWQTNVGAAGRYAFVPVVAAGSVYAANAAGELFKIDAASGKVDWRINTEIRLSTGPGTDGKTIVVGSPRGEVVAVEPAGKSLWKAHVSGAVLSAPVIEDGVVAVRSDDGRIFGLAVPDGRRRWLYQRALPALTVRAPAGLTAVPGGVYSGFAGGKLVAVLLKNGALAWEATIATPRGATELERVTDIVGAPLVDGRAVCAVAYQGKAGCFDALKGAQLWARDLSSLVPLSADVRYIYAIDDKDHVHALDKGTGASVWKQDKLAGRQLSGAVAVGGFLAVGDYQGYVHVLDRADGAFAVRVATDGSPILQSPVAVDGGVIVQTRNGGLFSIAIR